MSESGVVSGQKSGPASSLVSPSSAATLSSRAEVAGVGLVGALVCRPWRRRSVAPLGWGWCCSCRPRLPISALYSCVSVGESPVTSMAMAGVMGLGISLLVFCNCQVTMRSLAALQARGVSLGGRVPSPRYDPWRDFWILCKRIILRA